MDDIDFNGKKVTVWSEYGVDQGGLDNEAFDFNKDDEILVVTNYNSEEA